MRVNRLLVVLVALAGSAPWSRAARQQVTGHEPLRYLAVPYYRAQVAASPSQPAALAYPRYFLHLTLT